MKPFKFSIRALEFNLIVIFMFVNLYGRFKIKKLCK
jgi:hypothetical protein